MHRLNVLVAFAGSLGLLLTMAGTGQSADTKVKILHTPGKVRFGVLGEKGAAPAPTLFVLASEIEVTLVGPDFNKVGRFLAPHGWLCVALDVSCHGQDSKPGEPTGLAGWRARMEKGDNFVVSFAKQVSEVLDHLIAEGYTDKSRVALCGTSRGGFMALHCAALEPRFRAVAAFAPVTDLLKVTEFSGLEKNELANNLKLVNVADKLAGRPVWICIGNNDERVSTDECIAFSRAVTKSAISKKLPAAIEIHVMPSIGHSIHQTAHEEAAAWFQNRISAPGAAARP